MGRLTALVLLLATVASLGTGSRDPLGGEGGDTAGSAGERGGAWPGLGGQGNETCEGRTCWRRRGILRVALVTHSMVRGGVEQQILLTVQAVKARNAGGGETEVAFEAILFQEEGEWAVRLQKMGVPVRVFEVWEAQGKLRDGWELQVSSMVDHLRQFDVVHSWYGGGSLGSFSTFASHAARQARVPVVQNLAWNVVTIDLTVAIAVVESDETERIHNCGREGESTGLTPDMLRQLGVVRPAHQELIMACAFLSSSPGPDMASNITAQLQDLERLCGEGEDTQACLRRPTVVRVNPGLDLERFDPTAEHLAARRSASRSGGRVVTIGRVSRLVPEKAPAMLVRAAEHFLGRDDVRFRVWGEGEERAELERLIEELKLGGMVELMGATDDVEGALAEMDVFAYPTTGESVGWVILEAMAMGLPVVSTDVGAVPTFVRHMESGMLMDPAEGDPAVLAGLLEALVEDEELRERLGREGRRRALEEFPLARFGEDYGSVYEAAASVDWEPER